ncbi:ZIP zinc transporter-domain-containing protein [Crepidotus variabilis]|uniref:ZIP zinc transporter-domain-containing protein n=1 Tax=Crepidotus variabilis TaxID=179855 RepID=A0A9P6JSF4_9AGAR|nr:ZIP zinc transporter-domain-containing protein [Crepidotus variabilis]
MASNLLGGIAARMNLTLSSAENVESKIGVMVAILVISLFAVSFPTISKQTAFLRIPAILFFIGKHFGTGVILATAFIHLLDDAFRSLQNSKIKERYGRIGKWTGLIILVSLLAIFLVEYISTSYVEHLRDKPSAPPTPTTSHLSSPTSSPKARSRALQDTDDENEDGSRSRSPRSSHRYCSRGAAEATPSRAGNQTRGLAGQTGAEQHGITETTPLLLTNTGYLATAVTRTNPVATLLADPLLLRTQSNPVEDSTGHTSSQTNGGLESGHGLGQTGVKLPVKHKSTPNFHENGVYQHSHSREHPHPHPHHPHHSQYPSHSHQPNHPHHHPHYAPAVLIPDLLPIEVLNNSPRICRLGLVPGSNDHHPHTRPCSPLHGGHQCHCYGSGNAGPCKCHHQTQPRSRRHSTLAGGEAEGGVRGLMPVGGSDEQEEEEESRRGLDESVDNGEEDESHSTQHHHHHELGEHRPKIGRRRQVVGILVLQMGIMIHSLVIGLTLAVTSGSDFTSLTTAIIFHQLFEGLSLGIRIAALPPKPHKHHHHHHRHEDQRDDEETIYAVLDEHHHNHERDNTSMSNSSGSATAAALSTPESVDAIGKRRPGVTPGDRECCATRRHHSHSHNPSVWKRLRRRWRRTDIHWLKPTLSFLFAVTTPFGMCTGMMFWGAKKNRDEAQMLLIQGIMSAISAGMLIYAATVEMIAGDFVFGDVEGHGGHHHHHHEGGGVEHGHEHGHSIEGQSGSSGSSLWKKTLAVASLLMGSGMMVLVGLGE